jgi:hypothetical protein
MARGKKYQPEQVVNLLRQIEVAVADGKTTAQACKENGDRRTDLLPMAQGVWWPAGGPAIGRGERKQRYNETARFPLLCFGDRPNRSIRMTIIDSTESQRSI